MQKFDIAILTEDRYDNIVASDKNEANILLEDSLIQRALERKGFKVHRTSWSNPIFNWESARMLLIRTTWDYFDRFTEFHNWLEIVKNKSILINPYETLKWNIDKHYLIDLQNNGINIPATVFIEKGEQKTLDDLFNESKWNEVVLKPVVSGAARHTYRLRKENTEEKEIILDQLLRNEAMMFQEFQQYVLSKGEVAYMFMGGKFTHAVLKKAKPGDFRVQDDFGGSVELYHPNKKEVEFARNVLENCGKKTFYARVDVIYDNNKELCVSELELIEPELWFRLDEKAASSLAQAIYDEY
jgi:glutathione synthase/RimK-type ligase-like ATP-grasp enzyme